MRHNGDGISLSRTSSHPRSATTLTCSYEGHVGGVDYDVRCIIGPSAHAGNMFNGRDQHLA